jgi:plasmid stabilization system protein ParE
VSELIAAFSDLSVLREDAVHGALRAETSTLVEKPRMYLRRRHVHEPGMVEDVQDGLPLILRQRACRRVLSRRRRVRETAVVGRLG